MEFLSHEKMFKKIYKKNWKQKMMTWLNMSVAILNVTLQLLIIYKYKYRYKWTFVVIFLRFIWDFKKKKILAQILFIYFLFFATIETKSNKRKINLVTQSRI